MRDTLENFFQQKIIALHDRLSMESFSWNVILKLFLLYLNFYTFDCYLLLIKLTENLEAMFKIAFLKFNAWKLKQGQ